MMKTPAVYQDVTCCTEDLCNDKMKEKIEPEPSESTDSEGQPAHSGSGSGPTVCYVNGGGNPGEEDGELLEYLMPSVDPGLDPSAPRGVDLCARYENEGKTFLSVADETLCDTFKSHPEVYKNVMCCNTDYCNALEYHEKHPHSIPKACYHSGAPEEATREVPTGGFPTSRCATYVYPDDGETYQISANVEMCSSMKAQPELFKDVKCCDTDLCNTV